MRKVAVLLSVALLAMVIAPAFAADAPKMAASSTMTGYVTDSHCAAKGANAKHTKDCVEKCVKEGSKVQFMDDATKKLYDVDKDHAAAMTDHTGHHVKVTGSVSGTMLTVEKIEMAEAAKM